MRRRQYLQLLLLVCGLFTSPLGSMEQNGPTDSDTAVSVPHAGVRGAAVSVRVRVEGDSFSAVDFDPVFSSVTAIRETPTLFLTDISGSTAQHSTARDPTYWANAPPPAG